MKRNQIWPDHTSAPKLETLLLRLKKYPGFCNVCGHLTMFHVLDPNFREHVQCDKCKSINRYRQITSLLLQSIFPGQNTRFRSISDIPKELVIWNTERTRSLHNSLSNHLGPSYISSEYLGPDYDSGAVVGDVLHVDMQKTHFADSSLDYVISSDVLEHVPFYLSALKETHRILKTGGAHIFTVPFYQHRFSNEARSLIDDKGDLIHLKQPWYHSDPLRPEGVLCFNVFSMELLTDLEKIGFEPEIHVIRDPLLGILGTNGVVLVARKVQMPQRDKDLIFPDG